AEERAAFIQEKRKEYQEDMNIYELASEMIVDGVIPFDHLRAELCHRLQAYSSKEMTFTRRKHPVYPV
ncbi:acyl-CoA carboxylase subunit beta, partial [Paenarthrobacter aurescens]|nr:acyl-CoA carboxylase subunit beta [Paenarthrobacter aurescens]